MATVFYLLAAYLTTLSIANIINPEWQDDQWIGDVEERGRDLT
jgi:hypothetical protein